IVVAEPADFTFSPSPRRTRGARDATSGECATDPPINGFTGGVTLSASGLPAGASGSFAPNPATNSSTLSVTTTTSTPAGTYTVRSEERRGGQERTPPGTPVLSETREHTPSGGHPA